MPGNESYGLGKKTGGKILCWEGWPERRQPVKESGGGIENDHSDSPWLSSESWNLTSDVEEEFSILSAYENKESESKRIQRLLELAIEAGCSGNVSYFPWYCQDNSLSLGHENPDWADEHLSKGMGLCSCATILNFKKKKGETFASPCHSFNAKILLNLRTPSSLVPK